MSNALEITDSSFKQEVIDSNIPVLVDFWAAWCGPCKMIAPLLDEIASELEGKLKVGKVNVDNEQNTAMQYQVMSLPTLMLFKGGEPVQKIIGAQPKDKIMEQIKPHLG